MIRLIAYKPERTFSGQKSPSLFINEPFKNIDLESVVNRIEQLENNLTLINLKGCEEQKFDPFTEIQVFQISEDHADIEDLKRHLQEIKKYKLEQEQSNLEPCDECGAKPVRSNGICH